MPILIDFVFLFLRLRTYKSSITLLCFFQMYGNVYPNPTTKVLKLSEALDSQKSSLIFCNILVDLKIKYYLCTNKSRPLPVRLAYPAGHFYLWESDIQIEP